MIQWRYKSVTYISRESSERRMKLKHTYDLSSRPRKNSVLFALDIKRETLLPDLDFATAA